MTSTVRLGELVDVVAGGTPKRSVAENFDGEIPWVKISDMLQGVVVDTEERITNIGLATSSAKLLPPETLLFSIFATIGRTAVLGCEAATNQAIAGLLIRDHDTIDRNYLRRYLESTAKQLAGRGRGVAQANINLSMLRSHPIPVPPIEEQRRIAAVLDAADGLRAKRRQALAKLDTLTQSIFIDMFGDPFRPDAETAPLEELAEIIMGQSPPGHSYNEIGEGAPLLNGPSEFGPEHPSAVQWTTSPTRLASNGDILFCVRGATAGRLNWSDGEYCLGRGLAAIRVEPSVRAFLYRVLLAYYPRFQSAGVGSTFINISKKDLHSVPIPTADSGRMAEFGAAQIRLDSLRGASQADLQQLDTLFASVQQRAFRGDL